MVGINVSTPGVILELFNVTPRIPGIKFKAFIFIIRDLLNELAAPIRRVETGQAAWFMELT